MNNSQARPHEIGLDLRVGGLHSLRDSLKPRRCAKRIEVAVVVQPLLVWPNPLSHRRGSVSPFNEMPDDRDHRDYEKDVNEATNHRKNEEAQRPENN